MNKTQWQIQPNKSMALMLAKKQLVDLVYDAVNLEGINFTIPEVQTLLDGISLGGRKLTDQNITINQSKAWKKLFEWISHDDFKLTKERVCKLHSIAGNEEALTWGDFRNGGVLISGTDYTPPKHDQLDDIFQAMVVDICKYDDVYDQAIHIFLTMARSQFFFDVNKRMGRFMMNGHLLAKGYPAINIQAKRQLEFNEKMIRFYESGDQKEMNLFIRSCLDKRVIGIMEEASGKKI
ncbi:MAG: Fic family protein [Pseudomonadales bacterium]